MNFAKMIELEGMNKYDLMQSLKLYYQSLDF